MGNDKRLRAGVNATSAHPAIGHSLLGGGARVLLGWGANCSKMEPCVRRVCRDQ